MVNVVGRFYVVGIGNRVSEKDKKRYYSLVLEQDGGIITTSCDALVVDTVSKFKQYDVTLSYSEYNRSGYLKVINAVPVK